MQNRFLYICLFLTGLFMASCSFFNKGKSASSKTGWKYNDVSTGSFFVSTKFEKNTPPGMVPIEGGTFVMGASLGEDVYFGHYVTPRRVTIPSFFMDETEVANVDWREYLNWIRRNFSEDNEYYYNALPDTLVWRNFVLSYNEPYVYNYFRHPAYQDYPVVGITWEQVAGYCIWRTDRVNEKILRDKGILKTFSELSKPEKTKKRKGGGASRPTKKEPVDPFNRDYYLSGKYVGKHIDGKKMPIDVERKKEAELAQKAAGKKRGGGRKNKDDKPTFNRPVGVEDGILTEPYRLPTEAEWEYAALGLIGNSLFEQIADSKIYPWNGLGLRSPDKKTQGLFLGNFKRRSGDYMGTAGYLNDAYALTSPVKDEFPANDYGLYHMGGNVSEWTGDVYRQLTPEDVHDYSPHRGNSFEEKLYKDPETGELEKDKYGKVRFRPAQSGKKVSWDEKKKQIASGYDEEAENADDLGQGGDFDDGFDDGFGFGEEEDEVKKYNPDFKDHLDSIPEDLYGKSTLVSDKSRVYKGASWNDRAYWVNPATRRFLDQDKASAEIGFRCAMSMVGSMKVTSNSPEFAPSKRKKPKLKKRKRKR